MRPQLLVLGLSWFARSLPLVESFVGSGGQRRQFARLLPVQVHLQPAMVMSTLFLADAEDLPNILGINPIEAALIAGVLYYVYGSEVLYEYAREAGRLFSLYAPVVKDVSLDIFNEFRAYLEEDRERAALKKSGVDVDSIPRRTTNILEKFTETIATFSDLTSGKKEAGELQAAYSPTDQDAPSESLPASNSSSREKILRRKSKREVLESRNVDVDRIMEATDVVTRGEDLSTVSLTDSISAVKDRFSALGNADEAGQVGSEDDDWESTQMIPFPQEEDAKVEVGMSKFQQQMSGEWNDRVLRSDSSVEGMGSSEGGLLEDSFLQKWERIDRSLDKENASVPQEISALDLYSPSSDSSSASAKSVQALAVLQEIDKDYLRLRQRLLDLMQQDVGCIQENAGLIASVGNDDYEGPVGRKYWPPLAKQVR